MDEPPTGAPVEDDAGPEVIIVGAGAVGLAMALDLARRGVRIRIIDRDPPRSRRESRALGLQARTLEVLERLGVIDEVLAAGRPIDGFAYYVNGHRVLRVGVEGLDAPYPVILLLPQGHLEEILIRRLNDLGVTVERGVDAVAMEQDAHAVRLL
ncbi:MAG: FAD-dependent oxidoreductase, partial [Actinomycetota bacterium]|nr:FAD-dependent oxidoreductase [Actinomycetota bacterium]